jgi:hypothetical protein
MSDPKVFSINIFIFYSNINKVIKSMLFKFLYAIFVLVSSVGVLDIFLPLLVLLPNLALVIKITRCLYMVLCPFLV